MDGAGTGALAGALEHPRFEIIPMKGVDEQVAYLPSGATVTVTCSPTRGIEPTLDLAERLLRQGFRAVPHISARLVPGEAHLREIVRRLRDLDLAEIFVVGGDATEPAGPYSSALDLLRAMEGMDHGLSRIGVTAYPEPHPFIPTDTLRRALADKQRFATYLVTQMCFDADTIGRWLADARQQGITLPAYVGIPGVVETQKLLRLSLKIGVGDSTRFVSRHLGLAARLLRPGGYRPTELVELLAPYLGSSRYDIRGLHINTFNGVADTAKWRQQFLGHDARMGVARGA